MFIAFTSALLMYLLCHMSKWYLSYLRFFFCLQVTVTCCSSAEGTFMKPFVIYPGIRPKYYHFEGVNKDDYDIGSTPNGWISADVFYGWLANIFYPNIANKVQFPVIVFMDGHISHMNMAIAEFCKSHNIILYCLPPNSSHILQPLDASVFIPMKKHWNESLDAVKSNRKGLVMSKNNFFVVFDDCWRKMTACLQNAVTQFRKCGLVPFNPNAIAYDHVINISKTTTASCKMISAQEKIGMLRMLQVFMKNLSPDIRELFQAREGNSYNVEDDTALGCLWKCYREMQSLLKDPGHQSADFICENEENSTSAGNIPSLSASHHDANIEHLPITVPASPPAPAMSDFSSIDLQPATRASASLVEELPITIVFSDASTEINAAGQSSLAKSASVTDNSSFSSVQVQPNPVSSEALLEISSSEIALEKGNDDKCSSFNKKHMDYSENIITTRKVSIAKNGIFPTIFGTEKYKREDQKKGLEKNEKRKAEHELKNPAETNKKPRREKDERSLENDDDKILGEDNMLPDLLRK